jgi:hypothetical protein
MLKTSNPPRCVYCGKNIRKYTSPRSWCHNTKVYRSLADVQRDSNQKVVSLSYGEVMEGTSYWKKTIALGAKVGERIVTDYSTWDGESYVDEFFCNGTCCRRYAYKMARTFAPRRR